MMNGNMGKYVPNYWHALPLIPASIGKYIHYELREEFTYPFPNFNGETVEVRE